MGAPSQRTQRTQVITGTCNPRWNSSMQFFVRNLNEDVLCLTVFDKDYFAPNGNDKVHILKLRWIDTIRLLQIIFFRNPYLKFPVYTYTVNFCCRISRPHGNTHIWATSRKVPKGSYWWTTHQKVAIIWNWIRNNNCTVRPSDFLKMKHCPKYTIQHNFSASTKSRKEACFHAVFHTLYY